MVPFLLMVRLVLVRLIQWLVLRLITNSAVLCPELSKTFSKVLREIQSRHNSSSALLTLKFTMKKFVICSPKTLKINLISMKSLIVVFM